MTFVYAFFFVCVCVLALGISIGLGTRTEAMLGTRSAAGRLLGASFEGRVGRAHTDSFQGFRWFYQLLQSDLLKVPFRDPVGSLSDRTNQVIKYGHFEEPGRWF